jgi:hypothetical protein
MEFRAEVTSNVGWPLFVRGSYNPLARELTYVLILKTTGRIYGLDLGKDHHNPTCQQVGEKHKHHWREQYRTPGRAAFAATVPEGLPTMTGFLACKELAAGLASLFICSEHGDYQRIRTPYLYPDGDMVDLSCKVQDGIVTVSDLGETTRWLRMQTVSPRRTPKQSSLIEDICLNHGVEFYRGMLLARVDAVLK